MNTVRRGKRQVKGEEPKRVTLADFALHAPVDTLVELIQALIPLGLMAVGDCLKADVARLAGARYRRGDGLAGHVRWGRQRGSVYLADQKLPPSRFLGSEIASPARRRRWRRTRACRGRAGPMPDCSAGC